MHSQTMKKNLLHQCNRIRLDYAFILFHIVQAHEEQ